MRTAPLLCVGLFLNACAPDFLGPTGWTTSTRLEESADGIAALPGGKYLYASVGTKLKVFLADSPRGALISAGTVDEFAMGPQKLFALGSRLYSCGKNEVSAWDLKSPAAPVLLKRFTLPSVEPCADIEASDDVVLFAMPRWGVGVVDFKSPESAAVPASLTPGSMPRYLTWQTGRRAWVATESGLVELAFSSRTEAAVTNHATSYPNTFSLGRFSDSAMLVGNSNQTFVVDTSGSAPKTTSTGEVGANGHLHVRTGGAQALAQSPMRENVSSAFALDLRTAGTVKQSPLGSNERHSSGVPALFLDTEQTTYALGGGLIEVMRWSGP